MMSDYTAPFDALLTTMHWTEASFDVESSQGIEIPLL